MKQTIITMLVLGGVAMAAQTTENVAFASPSSTITTVNQYNLSEDWSLSLEFICATGPTMKNPTNPNGTTIIDSDVLGVKVYASKNAEAIVTIGSETFKTLSNPWSAWDISWALEVPIKLNLTYTADMLTVTAIGAEDSTQFTFSKEMKYDGDSVVSLTTGISQAQLSASASDGTKYWTLPTGTFTGTATATAPIPEPATATLSLLALAGLAARRRRK